MKPSLRILIETAALVLSSAVLFVGFFHVNNWVFSGLEYRQGVNWVFLPAGFRVILVLIMGLPASIGIMLGTWFIDITGSETSPYVMTLLNGVVSGFTPWLVMKVLDQGERFGLHLQELTTVKLMEFTLIYAACNAVLHQLSWWLRDHNSINLWVDLWPMFIGDAVGALLMLYAFKGLLGLLKSPSSNSKIR
ncbi:MAG: hypothetical protein RLZZ464_1320 [Pseudomonadota bacterium]|jgi:hypothetical protein